MSHPTIFVEVFPQNYENSSIFEVTLESLITLFVTKISENQELRLVCLKEFPENESKFVVDLSEFKYELINELPELAKLCKRPVLVKDNFVVAGLCSVARQIVKASNNEEIRALLGFREACLMACSESSIWTKFCEVDILITVKTLLTTASVKENSLNVPRDIVRFENHLKQPVKVHNVYKIAREKNNDKSIISGSPLDNLEHKYAEGVSMTLSDAILLIPFQILKQLFGNLGDKTNNWLENLSKHFEIPKFNFNIPEHFKQISSVNLPSDVPNVSLYISDTKRYRPQSRLFTKDNDVEHAIKQVEGLNLNILNENGLFGEDVPFDWNEIPIDANPEGGALPKKRANRKCDQLSSLTKPVIKIVKQIAQGKGMRIVDFCSGSGHLGILIATLLCNCEVILVENKERSLDRARTTIEKIGLDNVKIIQCNLDYFEGDFDLGTCLHACGVATDLVIQTCISKKAHFVACPCCYGSIHNCYHLTYPRSKQFASLNEKEYLNVAHAADQTHKDNSKTVQGFKCMDIIDFDRKLYAESKNYKVHLGKLQPPTCTPKNNLLVGILQM